MSDIKIKKGEVAHFQASFTRHDDDEPLPTVTWKKEGRLLHENKRLLFSCVGNIIHFKILNTQIDDTARYSVRLENQNGSTECSAQLIIQGTSHQTYSFSAKYLEHHNIK